MSTTSTKPITADELLAMGDVGRCELIYGELVMMSPAGAEHGVVAQRIARFLAEHVEANGLGVVFAAETGFKLATNPDLVRAPDVSWVRAERLARGVPKGFFVGAPDLAVEVVSPQDSKRSIAEKVNAWLAHGAASVWVADPAFQAITVHHTGKKLQVFSISENLRDEFGPPGLSISLRRVFRLP